MIFNNHLDLRDKHAILSPSKHYWLHYDDDRLAQWELNRLAAERGTRLHAYAHESIILGQKLQKTHRTLNMFVNDSIGFRMRSEQPLIFSDNCFGTADAISFEKKLLRIHDLKTGITPANMDQLRIYAALFCSEYHVDPNEINTELRIYQNDDIIEDNPTGDEISEIIELIAHKDKLLNEIHQQGVM